MICIGNIPYQITSPLLFKIWEEALTFRKTVLTVQKEVAERLLAQPGGKTFGLLTLKAQYFSEPKIEFEVPRQRFQPPPRVDSAVVSFKPLPRCYPPEREQRFFALLNGAFSQRRKTIINSIVGSPQFAVNKTDLLSALEACGMDPKGRAETFPLEDYHALFEALEPIAPPDE